MEKLTVLDRNISWKARTSTELKTASLSQAPFDLTFRMFQWTSLKYIVERRARTWKGNEHTLPTTTNKKHAQQEQRTKNKHDTQEQTRKEKKKLFFFLRGSTGRLTFPWRCPGNCSFHVGVWTGVLRGCRLCLFHDSFTVSRFPCQWGSSTTRLLDGWGYDCWSTVD